MKSILRALLFGCAAIASVAAAKAQEANDAIYLLVNNETTSRVAQFDIPNIRAALAKHAPQMKLVVLNAGDDMQQQVSQADAALAAGAKGIILIAVDPLRSASILAKAAADGVPVVTYAHDPGEGPVACHVSVPFADIGEAQAKYLVDHLPKNRPVRLAYMLGDPKFAFYTEQMKGFDKYIEPLVANGTVKIVCRADALLYLAANAQKNMEQCLTQTNNEVDGVVVMNDDTGGGVIAALTNQDLVGKVELFGGYDATLEGVQRVLAGWQAADMSPPYKAMADGAVQLVLAAAKGEQPPAGLVNGSWPNNFVEGGVPARLEPNVFITPDNVQQTVVDAGLYTKEQLCTGIAASSEFCAK